MSDGVDFDEGMVEQLEQIYRTATMSERRRRIRDALELETGEHVLSIGCGPGFESRVFADAVGEGGRVHGIDTAEPMLAVAREHCADQPQATFERGDATDVPVDDGAFDAAAAVQVYEYVPDLDAAFAELARVLGPGGRALVFDSDWSTLTYHAADPARSDRIVDAFDAHCPHPRLARTIKPRLERAGFEVVDQDSFVHFETELHENSLARAMIEPLGSVVTDEGGIGDDEFEAWVDDLHERAAAGEFFFSLNQYLFLADWTPDGI